MTSSHGFKKWESESLLVKSYFNFWPLIYKIPINNSLKHFLQGKGPSSVVLSHQNPLTCLCRIVWTVFADKWCLICTGCLCLSWFLCNIIDRGFKLKTSLNLLPRCRFSLHKTLIDGLESCWLLVGYCDVFTNCLDSHSDGTHSLQRIQWWASEVMQNVSKSIPMNKQPNLHIGWHKWEYFFIFGCVHPHVVPNLFGI